MLRLHCVKTCEHLRCMLLLLLFCAQALELGYWLRQQYIDTHGFLPASHKPGQCLAI
jgi:hypothetical protein